MEDELLTDSEKAYFSGFEEVFESSAWRALSEHWRRDLDSIPLRAFWSAESWDEILAARALCRKLEEYLTIPQQIALQKRAVIEERELQMEDNREASRPDV